MKKKLSETRAGMFLQKNRQLLVYLICSLGTTLAEMLIGWLILGALPERILIANNISLVLGAVAHYLLTTKYAFRVRHTVITVGMYAATFLLGLVIQDVAVAILYHELLDHLPEIWQYVLSKVISMAIALAVTYLIRDRLYEAIRKHHERKHHEQRQEGNNDDAEQK